MRIKIFVDTGKTLWYKGRARLEHILIAHSEKVKTFTVIWRQKHVHDYVDQGERTAQVVHP
jgi:hypothetical protein